MLTIAGRSEGRFCDGVSRRDFLRIGGLAFGGLTTPQLLRAEGSAGMGLSHKAVIMVFLAGGPPHQDMFDLKPDAPAGIRGEFRPIPTDVPGLEICEHMPRLAAMMSKFVVIRSLVGAGPEHSAGQCLTGYKDLVSRCRAAGPAWERLSLSFKGRSVPTSPHLLGCLPGPLIRRGETLGNRVISAWLMLRSRLSGVSDRQAGRSPAAARSG